MKLRSRWLSFLLASLATVASAGPSTFAAEPTTPAAGKGAVGVPVSYQLPIDGPLPRTYRVTLAAVDPKNPDWIISQFASGVARTVTAENAGKFSEIWDGLDENFMPVPPGTYALRGIYAPAERWTVDGQFHSITPKFVTGASSWMPSPEQANKPEPFGGDPVGAPLRDVAVGPNGLAVFYYEYLENGLNNPVFDLNKPVGLDQFVRAFPSGGAGGGTSTATDGKTVWSFSVDGGPKYVYRADQKPFGPPGGSTANRAQVYLPAGWVTAMAAWSSEAADPEAAPADASKKAARAVVFVAERGKFTEPHPRDFVESTTEVVDRITALDGDNGKTLAQLPLHRPRGLAVRGNVLYALHEADEGGGFVVSAVDLHEGLFKGGWKVQFAVPAAIHPFDLEVGRHSRFYLSEPDANKVHQLDAAGKTLLSIGRLDAQKSGAYDPLTLMSPGKLATWTDAAGQDRLLIVEQAGPNRVSEWAADGGKFIRDFLTLQTKANDGYAVDPDHPGDVYVPGHNGWLTRFKVDYAQRTWKVDAVWPNIGTDPRAPVLAKPVFSRIGGHAYIAGGSSAQSGTFPVYRLDGDRWVLSAAFIREPAAKKGEKPGYFFWHDADGNGRIDDAELRKTAAPEGVFGFHGQNWSADDLALLIVNLGSRDLYRAMPGRFDERGNPIFDRWEQIATDPVFAARAAGKADAVHGGNELANDFSSDWMLMDGSAKDGYYVQARGGKNFSANEGSQFKISRYIPDGAGGYRLKWRVGRAALQGNAREGELYGGMRLRRPINGLVPVIDQSRCGVALYTTDGLYVDTLFPDGRRFSPSQVGMYSLPGEFFAGALYPNRTNGKIYIAVGKYTPLLFEAQGWSLSENPVKPLTTVQPTVSLAASQIGSPPEVALSVRGGAGAARLARFAPAIGGAVLDGSMNGWEACDPVVFSADPEHSVEVRLQYSPDHLYLRWHARLGTKFEPKALDPPERAFAHDRQADTLNLYLQGDPDAKPSSPLEGRPGDVRVIFGLFKDKGEVRPVAIGMYPKWPGPGAASPQTYATPVNRATFEHVELLADAKLAAKMDDDGKGFVLTADLPRTAVPSLPALAGGFRTMVNFSANLGGHDILWWANRDGSANIETYDEPSEARLYPGSWAPAVFQGLDRGVVIRDWSICGPFGGPGAEKLTSDPNGQMPGTTKDWKQATRDFCEAATYPPDSGKVDPAAVFTGDLVQGYWRDPGEVRWRPAVVADLDTRVLLGESGQIWYGAAWVHAPAETEVEFQFQGHPMTPLRWFLNGQIVQSGEIPSEPGKDDVRRVARKTLKLRAGWNQVMFRGYCVGYPPARAGLILAGAPEKLWGLRLAATPPE